MFLISRISHTKLLQPPLWVIYFLTLLAMIIAKCCCTDDLSPTAWITSWLHPLLLTKLLLPHFGSSFSFLSKLYKLVSVFVPLFALLPDSCLAFGSLCCLPTAFFHEIITTAGADFCCSQWTAFFSVVSLYWGSSMLSSKSALLKNNLL